MNKDLNKHYEWVCINITNTNFVIFHAINKPRFPVTILINNKNIQSNRYLIQTSSLRDN